MVKVKLKGLYLRYRPWYHLKMDVMSKSITLKTYAFKLDRLYNFCITINIMEQNTQLAQYSWRKMKIQIQVYRNCFNIRPKKKMFISYFTLPTLIFCPYPNLFIAHNIIFLKEKSKNS